MLCLLGFFLMEGIRGLDWIYLLHIISAMVWILIVIIIYTLDELKRKQNDK